MNSSIQSLFLNPLGNFDLSLCIPGFDNSTFIPLRLEGDSDYQVMEQAEQDNYLSSIFEENPSHD